MLSFEQSSTRSPFGQTNSVFGPNNSSNNPFSPKPFGTTTASGTSTGPFGETILIFGPNDSSNKAFEGIGISTVQKELEAAWKRFEAVQKERLEAVGATSTPVIGATRTPFGYTIPVLGLNNSSNNSFSPEPFGSTTPFGSRTDSSLSGGTSTGAFGAFEQSSTRSPFGQTISVFGPNNSSNNPFSPKPFGSTTPFGSQTDSSISESEKSVMTSCGFQAGVKALQEDLSAENLP